MKEIMVSYHPNPLFPPLSPIFQSIIHPSTLLLLLPLPSTEHPTHTSRHTSHTTLHALRRTLPISTQWALAFNVLPVLIFPTALRTIDPLFTHRISQGLRDAALAHGTGYEAVNAVLDLVDLIDARDFGFVEVFCCGYG
jgi:hypothetical protein